eukprot:3940358-Rhodomonas_salina.4
MLRLILRLILATMFPPDALSSHTHSARAARTGGRACSVAAGLPLHPEIQCKKPQVQYNLYQECGFLCLISGCSLLLRDLRHAPRPSN